MCLFHNVQTDYGARRASYPIGSYDYFHKGKAAGEGI